MAVALAVLAKVKAVKEFDAASAYQTELEWKPQWQPQTKGFKRIREKLCVCESVCV